MSPLRILIVLMALPTLAAAPALGQEPKGYVMVSFGEDGKVEDGKAWAKTRDGVVARAPNTVFVIAHGWRTSQKTADKTVAEFAKLLREQQARDEAVEIIGIRWPSLIGEGESPGDVQFKGLARGVSAALANSTTVKEKQASLKEYLKKPATRSVASLLHFPLPEDEALDAIIDGVQDPDKVEHVLTAISYYSMKKRARDVGAGGVANCLSELQAALPKARFHLVGHSFGCKLCLACLASESRAEKQVDSVTLVQAAVSHLCFAPQVKELKGKGGAYAEVTKRVRGCISVTYTANDKALTMAYPAASHAAGQVAELPGRKYQLGLEVYRALGACGVAGCKDVPTCDLGPVGSVYTLGQGLNGFNATKVISCHSDIRREEVAWLIWSTARYRP